VRSRSPECLDSAGNRGTAPGDLPELPIVDVLGTSMASMPALVHPITPNRLLSPVMNRFGPTNARVVPRSVARRAEVYSPQGVTGESIRVGGG